jgi:hypothetical protein
VEDFCHGLLRDILYPDEVVNEVLALERELLEQAM